MPRRRKIAIGVTIVVVALAGLVGGLLALTALVERTQEGPVAPTQRLTGDLLLADRATEEAECVGQGEHAAVRPGATVRVQSRDGEHLADGRLGDPVRDADLDTCTYPIVVDGVPLDEQVYVVSVGEWGADYTRNQLEGFDWQVALHAGDV